MAIYVNLNVVMAQRRISSQELAAQVGITQANLSILKTGKAKAIRFSTLDAICKALDCQPGDILEYREEESQSNPALMRTTPTPRPQKLPPSRSPRLLPCLQAAGRPSWPYSWRCWPPSQPTASCTVAWPWAALWESSEFSPSQPCIF